MNTETQTDLDKISSKITEALSGYIGDRPSPETVNKMQKGLLDALSSNPQYKVNYVDTAWNRTNIFYKVWLWLFNRWERSNRKATIVADTVYAKIIPQDHIYISLAVSKED